MTALLWLFQPTGLNTLVRPVETGYDERVGVRNLALAVNVLSSRDGAVKTRPGYDLVSDGVLNVHSMYSGVREDYCVSDGTLGILDGNYAVTELAEVTPGLRMDYATLGKRVFYLNGREKGFIANGVRHAWTAGADTKGQPGKTAGIDPPLGTVIGVFNSSILIGQGTVVWWSDPFSTNVFYPSKNMYDFGSRVTGIMPVKDGVYIGTEGGTYFVEGRRLDSAFINQVSSHPVIEGTAITLDGEYVGFEPRPRGKIALWTSRTGICIGYHDGTVINLTNHRISYPMASYGTASLVGENYIVCLGDRMYGQKVVLVFNLINGFVSQFQDYHFSSLMYSRFKRKFLGANETGVFNAMTGDVDYQNDINSFLKTFYTDFGTHVKKCVRFLYMDFVSNGPIETKLRNEKNEEYVYEVPGEVGSFRRNAVTVPCNSKARGTEWNLEIRGIEGSSFHITTVRAEVLPHGSSQVTD